jgi:mono/diheme cytochrome c family protein
MAEVVYNSLQYMSDEDTEAMAVYLKALPQRESEPPPPSSARLVQPAVMESGDATTRSNARCATAARARASSGVPAARGQPVDHDDVAGELDPHGVERRISAGHPQEPASPRHAALRAPPGRRGGRGRVTYIRVAWNNTGTPVTPQQVNELRKLLPE